jgi:putative MATE family efflux protein
MSRPSAASSRTRTSLRDWTQGGILRNLLALAWPVIIGSCLNNIGTTIDMIWVGKLGASSVAGVGVAGMLVSLLDSLKMGLDMGTRALIARHIGAGDRDKANTVALQGYIVTIGFAATVGVLGVIFSSSILRVMGLSPEVVAQGAPYLRIQFIGILTMGLVRQNEGTMQSSGDTVGPMRVAIVYRLFHIVLCPFLVFGWWVFPRLGVSGAAYTGIISACLGAALGLWLLLTGRTRLTLRFRGFRPDFGMIWRIVRVGVPASVTGMERTFGQLIMIGLVVPFGTLAVAAHTLTQQVDQFINIAGGGLGQASGIMAGLNLGAQRPDRAARSGWVGASLYTAIMVLVSLPLFLWGRNIIAVFNNEHWHRPHQDTDSDVPGAGVRHGPATVPERSGGYLDDHAGRALQHVPGTSPPCLLSVALHRTWRVRDALGGRGRHGRHGCGLRSLFPDGAVEAEKRLASLPHPLGFDIHGSSAANQEPARPVRRS